MVCVHTRCADSVKEGTPTPAMATASGSPAAKGGADVSNGGSNERTASASSNGRTTLKSGSPAPLKSGAPSVWKEREASAWSGRKKERAAVSASLNGTALKKSATSKGRNINSTDSTVACSATTNSTVHQSCRSPYRTSNNQNETVHLPNSTRTRSVSYANRIDDAVVDGTN